MTNIVISDLTATQELDGKTMARTKGGLKILPFPCYYKPKRHRYGTKVVVRDVQNNGNILSQIANGQGQEQSFDNSGNITINL